MKYFNVTMNLGAFTHVVMTKKNKAGEDVEGVFIPLEMNRIKKDAKGGKYFNGIAFEMNEPKEWGTHIIKHSLTKKEREEMSEEEQNALPIIGNAKLSAPTATATDNDAGGGETFDADSETGLPF